MQKYQKKPVVVEAVQLVDTNAEEVAKWCGGELHRDPVRYEEPSIKIQTLEGEMTAAFGDWVIQGVKGEFYPCKPDIFEATYEVAA